MPTATQHHAHESTPLPHAAGTTRHATEGAATRDLSVRDLPVNGPRVTLGSGAKFALAAWIASTAIVAAPSALAQAESRDSGTSAASTEAASNEAKSAESKSTDTATAGAREQIHVAIAEADPYVQAFNEHLTILASPWMEGRLPGTKGMERAMDYMEHQFRVAGLEPAFQPADGAAKSYRQPFSLGGKRETIEESISVRCEQTDRAFTAGKDFQLTGLGKSGVAEGALACVGYGMEDGPDGYSSFAPDHSLEGKIALLLRFEPMDENGNSRWSGGEGWSGRAGAR